MKRAHVKTARAPVAVVAAAAVIAVVGAAAAVGVAGASTADRAKAPNTKLHAPEKLQVSNPKCQPRLVLGIFSWSLGFGVSMELGASHSDRKSTPLKSSPILFFLFLFSL